MLGAANGDHGHQDGIALGAVPRQQGLGGIALEIQDGQEQVFGGDVLIVEVGGLLKSLLEDGASGRRGLSLQGAPGPKRWQLVNQAPCLGQDCLAVDANLAQHRYHRAFAVGEEAGKQMEGHELGVAALGGEMAGGLHRLLRLGRQFVPTRDDRHVVRPTRAAQLAAD